MNASNTIANLDTVISMISDAQKTLASLDKLPQTSEELGKLLDELADAEQGCHAHFVLYAEERKHEWINQSKDCRQHWSSSLRRRDRAQEAMIKFAVARREAQS